jgi:hypothetical protein
MARVKIQAGAEFDILNKDELDRSLKDNAKDEWGERARGMKRLRFIQRPGASLTTSAGWILNATPNQGYTWNLRFVSAALSAAQTVQFYLGSDTNTGLTVTSGLAPLVNAASAVIGTGAWGSGQVWIDPDDYLVIWAGGTATLNAVHVVVIETPAELAWKLM